ncbi:unnamed protein product [Phytophthora lilii]|uniref:Unnamed protein product n=1 Tax=Phytophthora lilii TaxID=2077276 RepID=A0A9W6X5Q0_9STRA|nr:unnamed protein product [Phytophthora lilii]
MAPFSRNSTNRQVIWPGHHTLHHLCLLVSTNAHERAFASRFSPFPFSPPRAQVSSSPQHPNNHEVLPGPRPRCPRCRRRLRSGCHHDGGYNDRSHYHRHDWDDSCHQSCTTPVVTPATAAETGVASSTSATAAPSTGTTTAASGAGATTATIGVTGSAAVDTSVGSSSSTGSVGAGDWTTNTTDSSLDSTTTVSSSTGDSTSKTAASASASASGSSGASHVTGAIGVAAASVLAVGAYLL